ncbi:Mga2p [Sugiyamaella lignohabitans]|uniref:Mga2p n=1 Tax=Sugiyamaella lignohabitans TaxID=796027 RepID=A0A167DN48_9ASCO|nr:Mga2p [Sugiyamaella lignohabitans]ANB13093.1 Mga2p [Sugiyamaella lignohabitans]
MITSNSSSHNLAGGMNGGRELSNDIYIDYNYDDEANQNGGMNDNGDPANPNSNEFDIPGFDFTLSRGSKQPQHIIGQKDNGFDIMNVDDQDPLISGHGVNGPTDVDQMMDYLEFGEGTYSGSSSSLSPSLSGDKGGSSLSQYVGVGGKGADSKPGDSLFAGISGNSRNTILSGVTDGASPNMMNEMKIGMPSGMPSDMSSGMTQGMPIGVSSKASMNIPHNLSDVQISGAFLGTSSSQSMSLVNSPSPTSLSSSVKREDSSKQNIGKSTGTSFSSQAYSESYRDAQVLISKMIFGRQSASVEDEIVSASTTTEPISEILAYPERCETYKYRMHVVDIPSRSRVETQIKCRLIFSPTPDEHLLHLPADTMARPRFQLKDKFVSHPNTLSLEVDVVAQNLPDKPLYMCSKCISREMKRAFRKKSLDPNEEYHWNPDRRRRIVIFNCREVVAFPLPLECDLGNGQTVKGKEIVLPLRLGCYCRHHGAKPGYK